MWLITAHKIFTLKDILTYVPVFSKNHAIKILEVLSEFFDDFEESVLTDLSINNQDEDQQCKLLVLEDIMASEYTDVFEDSLDIDFI